MSSAHGEAEDGRVHDVDNEEEEEEEEEDLPQISPGQHKSRSPYQVSIPTILDDSNNDIGLSETEESLASRDGISQSDGAGQRRGETIEPKTPNRLPAGTVRPSSADGSLSIPDDSPSVQGSLASSTARHYRSQAYGQSPTPSLRPFDRRFQTRLASRGQYPRASSPAFLNIHSRQSSLTHMIHEQDDTETPQTLWDVVRWAKLRKITGQAFSELGKRNFGRPTCIAVSASIALGTSKGIILVFDYNQDLKSIIGPGTKAVECGAVTSIAISADLSTIAGGHASGNIFTWDLAKPAKPFLQVLPIDRQRNAQADGHLSDAAILHLGFLGTRHTALVSADDKGMAFSHLATRSMAMVARTVRSTRILGRYPDITSSTTQSRKPSSVLAFSPLPLGNVEHAADSMGLVAMLTPYLLVIVSTTPIAQTQYKTARPKELAHTAMSAALAWFPSVKLKGQNVENMSRAKLVYCWSNILTVLEIIEVEPSDSADKDAPPTLQFRPRSRWKAEEAIVAVQWLGRSVLAVLTITQQLVILEDVSMRMTDTSDLIQKHVYHTDMFSQNLSWLVENLDEEDTSMHGVVADAFYMSFRAYKGRLFLLGYSEVTFGTLSNWADRLLALMEDGDFIGAIGLATSYYTGESEKVTVGLPEEDASRHEKVREKLLEMMTASLKYAFGKNKDAQDKSLGRPQVSELAAACVLACATMNDLDFLFDDVYEAFTDAGFESIFLEALEPHILEGEVESMPPTVVKYLVEYYTSRDLNARLEEMICHFDPRTMDIDQVTSLCKRNGLWDALLYVWDQALGDFTTILNDLLDLAVRPNNDTSDPLVGAAQSSSALKVFPYLSYILTGRIYPTGKDMSDDQAFAAKAVIYHYLFSGSNNGRAQMVKSPNHVSPASFPNLRKLLDFDAPSFLSMLNEAFEDPFLNGSHPQAAEGRIQNLTEEETFGSQVNRQWIISILLEVMVPPEYDPEDIIYLNMFIARNLPKFPQFVLLPGHVLHRVLEGLCRYPEVDLGEDCQLSVEYLMSIYQPPDLPSLIPIVHAARFYRVLKSIYKTEKQYAKLLEICFEDVEHPDSIFECVGDCLRPSTGLNDKKITEVRAVLVNHASAFVAFDPTKAATAIEQYTPDLHGSMLQALSEDDQGQLMYLRTILEPNHGGVAEVLVSAPTSSRTFIEQYVRLLCDYDPHHVSEYVEHLNSGDLRLEEVLSALESSGVVDAAVVLMAREGKVREGIDRLTQHLRTLGAALIGLLDGAQESPDAANTAEAAQDLAASIQKYVRVGLWLCRGHTKHGQLNVKQKKGRPGVKEELTADENLWLDLIDAVVEVSRNISEVLEPQRPSSSRSDSTTLSEQPASLAAADIDRNKLATQLRSIVQETFTALLATTSAPRTTDVRRTDASFLRILRAFLSRASMSSSSLTNLRSVLASIFSAYAYEESLLALANRLLDKDLFVHVTGADTLRRRGWRPLGQVCEGCSRRVWGPGTRAHIWDAWERGNDVKAASHGTTDNEDSGDKEDQTGNGKGKAVVPSQGKVAAIRHGSSTSDSEADQSQGTGIEDPDGSGKEELGPLVIFACRHMFHQTCLRKVQATEEEVERGNGPRGSQGLEMTCPLCPDEE